MLSLKREGFWNTCTNSWEGGALPYAARERRALPYARMKADY